MAVTAAKVATEAVATEAAAIEAARPGLPVPEAAPAIRARVPSRRTIKERAATAKGTAMPAIAATAVNLDDRPVLILRQRGNRHRLCFTETGQGDARKKRKGHKPVHEHSPISRLEK
jgi:hypothetical protein